MRRGETRLGSERDTGILVYNKVLQYRVYTRIYFNIYLVPGTVHLWYTVLGIPAGIIIIQVKESSYSIGPFIPLDN